MIELPNNAMQLTKGGWMRMEAPSSARLIMIVGEVVRPSQLIASVGRTSRRGGGALRAPCLLTTMALVLACTASGLAAPQVKAPPIMAAELVVEARVVAKQRGVCLELDDRDVPSLAKMLDDLRARWAAGKLSPAELGQEARLWSAVLGEIVKRVYPAAEWRRAQQRNRRCGISLYVPVEGGTWLESDECEMIERLIREPLKGITVEQRLTLHILE
jgi:hypothetical protein